MNLLHPEDRYVLFQRLAKGDEAAFRTFFESYNDKLYFIALKMIRLSAVAEEVVQDIFMQVWMQREKFQDIADPEAYVISMTYNGVFRHMKKIARDELLLNELIMLVQKETLTVEDLMLAKESSHLISEAVEALPAQQKKVFDLSRHHGMTYKQIAQELNISSNTVRNHLTQALKQIREHLGLALLLY